jgi:predicted lipoprotein with Yx(FWY)xxD motif
MHTSPHRSHPRYAVGLVGFGMLVLAACGASGSSYSSPPASTAVPNEPPANGSAVVSITTGTKLGSVLADPNARTLYTLTRNGASVPCTSQCAAIWPPLTLPAGTATAATVPEVTGIGTTTNGGRVQVTEMNQPLYRFSGDTKPGDTNGDGITSFGGQWQAVLSGGVVPNTAPSSTGGGSSGGYGY